MTTFTKGLKSHDKILMMTSWSFIMMSFSLFQNRVIFKRAGRTSFANIIKIAVTLIKITFKDSVVIIRNPNYVLNLIFIFIFLHNENC